MLLMGLAVEFLLEHGFRLDAPFLNGVPYLSRDEEAFARLKATAREDGAAIADIFLKPEDLDSLKFVRQAREDIKTWKERTIVGLCNLMEGSFD